MSDAEWIATASEAEWQAKVMRYLCRPGSPLRLYRQNAGKIIVDNNDGTKRAVNCAPDGASDLVGLMRPSGRYVTIECKKYRDRTSKKRREKQAQWREAVNSFGGIAVESKPDPSRTIEENLMGLEAEIMACEEARQ